MIKDRSIALACSGGMVIGCVLALASTMAVRDHQPIVIQVVTRSEPALVPASVTPVAVAAPVPAAPEVLPPPSAFAPAAPVHSRALQLAFSAGGATYIKLVDLGGAAEIKHGKPHLVKTDDTAATAIASVAQKDIPVSYRAWLGKKVVVEGTCTATVVELDVLARTAGEPPAEHAWTIKETFDGGATMLVGKLDTCTGAYARDATLLPVVLPIPTPDADLAAAARRELIASPASAEAQKDWADHGRSDRWSDTTPIDVDVVRHPTTGVTWVFARTTTEPECGIASPNLFGAYRVDKGVLVPVEVRRMTNAIWIDGFVDIDDDGTFELIGHPWLGSERVITSTADVILEQLSLPWHGCPC